MTKKEIERRLSVEIGFYYDGWRCEEVAKQMREDLVALYRELKTRCGRKGSDRKILLLVESWLMTQGWIDKPAHGAWKEPEISSWGVKE